MICGVADETDTLNSGNEVGRVCRRGRVTDCRRGGVADETDTLNSGNEVGRVSTSPPKKLSKHQIIRNK